jgi:hypothetical protein
MARFGEISIPIEIGRFFQWPTEDELKSMPLGQPIRIQELFFWKNDKRFTAV